jgi:Ala-tRNA(Pro) deacylase
MELHHGRPDQMAGREDREIRVYDFLDSLGIEYWQTDHEKRANTMADCKEVDAVLEATICKNLFRCNRQKTDFYLLMMPGDKPFKTKEIPPQIGSARLSFAPEEKMTEFLDIHPGAVSVMGLMNDQENHVQLLVDEGLKQVPRIAFHPCDNTHTLAMNTADFFEKFLPAVGHAPRFVEIHDFMQ